MESFLNDVKHSLRVVRQSPSFTITPKIFLSILSVLGAGALTQGVSSQSLAQSKPIVIAASRVLDGKGHVLHDTRIVIEGTRIVAIDPKAGRMWYRRFFQVGTSLGSWRLHDRLRSHRANGSLGAIGRGVPSCLWGRDLPAV